MIGILQLLVLLSLGLLTLPTVFSFVPPLLTTRVRLNNVEGLTLTSSLSLQPKLKTRFEGVPFRKGVSLSRHYLFRNFFRIIASNWNAFLRSLEDPEKMLDQALEEMQRDLTKARQAYAEVTSGARRLEKRLSEGDVQMQLWYTRAQSAMTSGDEALAKEALRQRELQRKANTALSQQARVQTDAQEKLRQALVALENKVVEAQQQRQAFAARAKAAKTTLQVNQMLDSLTATSSSAVETFARMKDKVEALEAQAEVSVDTIALSSSSPTNSMAGRFGDLESDRAIEEELQRLKQSMGRSELPVLVFEEGRDGSFVLGQRDKTWRNE